MSRFWQSTMWRANAGYFFTSDYPLFVYVTIKLVGMYENMAHLYVASTQRAHVRTYLWA